MFSRRKRRPEEEETLVPHGLIWHATAESSGRSEKTPSTYEAKTANVLEMVRAVPPPKPTVGAPDVTGKKPARGTPLFWHSLAARTSALPPSADEKPLAPAPIPIRPASVPVAEASKPRPSVSWLEKTRTQTAARLGRIRSRVGDWHRSAQENAKRVRALPISALRQALEWWRRARLSLRALMNRMASLNVHARKTMVTMGEQSRRWRVRIHLPKPNWSFDWSGIFSSVVRRARAFSWHLPRVSGGGKTFAVKMEILATRELAKWKLGRPHLNRHEPVTRALPLAVPAFLLLGVVFAVRHYATEALPSHIRPAAPAAYRPVPAPARPRPVRHEPRAPLPGKSKLVSRGKRTQTAPAATRAQKQDQKQSESDDVAPDTYVYYGQQGKNGR